MNQQPLRIGVSACLLGQPVRYNGGHKRDRFLTDVLGAHVEWVPLCPEVAIGLGTPRETIRLEGDVEGPKLVAPKSGRDLTKPMEDFSQDAVKRLAELEICGYVFKSRSPSCGAFRVKVYNGDRVATNGRGLFANAVVNGISMLPVEEEGRLNDLPLRESFIERIFAYHRWLDFVAGAPRPSDLVSFHSRHKLQLMSHGREGYRQLGHLVADLTARPWPDLLESYGREFMEALKKRATARKHADVLYHVMGYLKKMISAVDKKELVDVIEEYRLQRLPLVVPLTLLRHHIDRCDVHQWLREQIYLSPYPRELMLRNHV